MIKCKRRPMVILLFVALLSAYPANAADRRARLELFINDIKSGNIDILLRGDDVLARAQDLVNVGLNSIAETQNEDAYISLKSLFPALRFLVGESDLSLRLMVDSSTVRHIYSNSAKSETTVSTMRAEKSGVPHHTSRGFDSMGVGSGDLRALLKLTVNRTQIGAIAVFLREDDVLVRFKDIAAAGLGSLTGRTELIRSQRYVSLKSLEPAVRFTISKADLTLRVQMDSQHSNSWFDRDDSRQPAGATQARIDRSVVTRPAGDIQEALLDLMVNQIAKQEISVLLKGDDVLARVDDLMAAGITVGDGRRETIGKHVYVSLKSLAPQIRYEVREKELSLALSVDPVLLGMTSLDLYRNRPPKIEYREEPSGFLNYSFNLQNFSQFSAFSEAGINLKNTLLYSGLSRNFDGRFVRGLSNLTISNRDNLIRTVVGDRLVSSDPLGGGVIMGGVSFFREFGLDPYFTPYPGLHYSGAVATPSTLDVIVNDRLLQRVQLPPGQFDLRNLPVPTGSADTRFVLRDAFGRIQESTSPFYFTAGLLQPGLHEFSYNLGSRRVGLDQQSWQYERAVFVARHRFGLTDALTPGFRLEATQGLVSGGPSLSFLLPIGEMELSGAYSRDHDLNGAGAFLGYSYSGQSFSLGSSLRFLSSHYATTSVDALAQRSRLQSNAFVTFPISSRAALTVRHTFEDRQNQGKRHQLAVSTSYRLVDGLQLSLRGTYQHAEERNISAFFAGLTYYLSDTTISSSYSNADGIGVGTLAVQKPLPTGPGLGYRLQGNFAQDRIGTDSIFQYQSPYGRYELFHQYNNGQNFETLQASGGLAFIGNTLKPTRALQESFALIQVPGHAGVRGYMNNLEIGRTDSNGDLFAPDILPYYGNRISISDKDIPFNYIIESTERVVATPFRGGAVISFPVRRVQRFTGSVRLYRSGKETIPRYGQLTVMAPGEPTESPLGKLGEFYFENLAQGSHPAVIEYQEHSCEFTLVIPASDESEIDLGTVQCGK